MDFCPALCWFWVSLGVTLDSGLQISMEGSRKSVLCVSRGAHGLRGHCRGCGYKVPGSPHLG